MCSLRQAAYCVVPGSPKCGIQARLSRASGLRRDSLWQGGDHSPNSRRNFRTRRSARLSCSTVATACRRVNWRINSASPTEQLGCWRRNCGARWSIRIANFSKETRRYLSQRVRVFVFPYNRGFYRHASFETVRQDGVGGAENGGQGQATTAPTMPTTLNVGKPGTTQRCSIRCTISCGVVLRMIFEESTQNGHRGAPQAIPIRAVPVAGRQMNRSKVTTTTHQVKGPTDGCERLSPRKNIKENLIINCV